MHVNLPPMGWNSWNTFGSEINEKVVMESADVLAESGLRDAGYNYLVIDDHWHLKERGADGRMVPDPEKFPHGMKYVADYVHSKGLKFGMYTCSGYLTCGGHPGSYDNEWIDVQTFAEWEIDFLKYDFCFYPKTVRSDIFYKRIRLALSNCGRDILFSACTAGLNNSRQWIREAAPDMWRSSGDINDSWQSIKETAEGQLMAQEYNAKGCFNDMDMLVVGMNGKGNVGFKGCTAEEYKTHFSLWALLNSPLMIGCDIREMDESTKSILMNKAVIAINQDPKGSLPFFANNFIWKASQCRRSDSEPHFEKYPLDVPIIAKYLDNGDIAVGIFNFMDTPASRWHMTLTCDNLGLPLNCSKTFEAIDLWTGEVIKPFNGTLMIDHLEPHACRLFRLKIIDR